jgi:hypothetical protein
MNSVDSSSEDEDESMDVEEEGASSFRVRSLPPSLPRSLCASSDADLSILINRGTRTLARLRPVRVAAPQRGRVTVKPKPQARLDLGEVPAAWRSGPAVEEGGEVQEEQLVQEERGTGGEELEGARRMGRRER